MDLLHLPSCVFRRPSRGQRQKLNHMTFKQFDMLGSWVPRDGFACVYRKAALRHSATAPIHPRIVHDARKKIRDQVRDPSFSAKAVEKRELLCGLRGDVCTIGASGWGRRCWIFIRLFYFGFLDSFFARAFAAASKLFRLGHALAGPLIRFAAAGSKKVCICLFGWSRMTAKERCERRHRKRRYEQA